MNLIFKNIDIKIDKNVLLTDVNVKFEPGKFYGILGKSGSGKTTFLKSILNNELITKGNLFINNKDMKKITTKDFRKIKKDFGFLFQETSLLDNLDVYENITLLIDNSYKNWLYRFLKILTKEQKAELNRILQTLEIDEKIYTPIKFLSGGEKHRVEMAALLFEPKKIILADEPTTGLDSANAQLIFKLLKEYAQKHNAIVICNVHDVQNSINYLDETYLIKDNHLSKVDLKKASNEQIQEFYE